MTCSHREAQVPPSEIVPTVCKQAWGVSVPVGGFALAHFLTHLKPSAHAGAPWLSEAKALSSH